MPYGLYLSAEGANAQAQRLEVISNNLANVDTVGFKQDVPTFQARFSEAIQKGLATPHDGSVNDIGGGVKLINTATDFSTGELKRTGNDLDLAITGKGFFHVRDKDGKKYLTRAGSFGLDITGRLTTQNGHRPVLDQAGNEIILDPTIPFELSQDGFIKQSGDVFAIGLSVPQSMNDFVKVGHNMFQPLGQIQPVPLEERNIRQGFLEMSGANSVRQMMAMIETSRAFESNSRMIQNQDSLTGTLIGRVLHA